MRIESSVTSVSWIPSEAIKGMTKTPFEMGVAHYDPPPPDVLDLSRLEDMRDNDKFRFANHLRAWIDVQDGRIANYGQDGSGVLNNTHMKLGSKEILFTAVGFPDIRPHPVVTATSATFQQTAGGRPGMPAPRRVRRKPFFQLTGPTVWTTLKLTLHADGRIERELTGATPFPRHWVYDEEGKLIAKTGTIDFKEWYHKIFGTKGTPWGNQDSPAFVIMAESAMERELSGQLMRAQTKPEIRNLKKGDKLTEQGARGGNLYLILDGAVTVEVNGDRIAELGPGSIVGERALLEGGNHTATLTAVTPLKVAVASHEQVDYDALAEIAKGHRREENPS